MDHEHFARLFPRVARRRSVMDGFFDSARAAFLVVEPDEHWVRAQFVVCSECRGRGVIVPSGVDEFGDEFLDQYHEHREAWTCNHCGGERVMPVPETDRGSDGDATQRH